MVKKIICDDCGKEFDDSQIETIEVDGRFKNVCKEDCFLNYKQCEGSCKEWHKKEHIELVGSIGEFWCVGCRGDL